MTRLPAFSFLVFAILRTVCARSYLVANDDAMCLLRGETTHWMWRPEMTIIESQDARHCRLDGSPFPGVTDPSSGSDQFCRMVIAQLASKCDRRPSRQMAEGEVEQEQLEDEAVHLARRAECLTAALRDISIGACVVSCRSDPEGPREACWQMKSETNDGLEDGAEGDVDVATTDEPQEKTTKSSGKREAGVSAAVVLSSVILQYI